MSICRWFKKLTGEKVLQENGVDVPTVIEISPIPPPPATPKVYDKGLTPDKVTSNYDLRLIIDTQAKLDDFLKDSNGRVVVRNSGGPWFKNLNLVNMDFLQCDNVWTVLFENVELVKCKHIEGINGKTGVELKGETHLECDLLVGRNNFRIEGSNNQGEALICNSEDSSFYIKRLISSESGDSAIDNKGVGVVDYIESNLDNGGVKNHNRLTIHGGKITNCGRGKRTSFGYGVQSRADGGQDAITFLGSVTIENCKTPDQSIKASVVTSGKKAIVDIYSQSTVKRPSGYTGSVFSEVGLGADIPQSSRDKVTLN